MKKILSAFVLMLSCATVRQPVKVVALTDCFNDGQLAKAKACAISNCGTIEDRCTRLTCVVACIDATLKSIPGCEKFIPKEPIECQ